MQRHRHIKLSLDEATIATGRELAAKYGKSSSLSSVVRRAVSLLADEWQRIDATPGAGAIERAHMGDFLSDARRGSALL